MRGADFAQLLIRATKWLGEPFQGAAGEYGFDGLRFALLLGRLGLHAPLRPASSRVQKGERRLR
jgi:hypothetical protein